ncbi:MAG: hypothetical protein ACI82S_001739 [Patiriisocius sp.]|jgi:hypothetical protein
MPNSMEIGHIQNHCLLLGESIDLGLMGNQINQLARTSLPSLIAQELNKQLPDTEHSNKVYRINKLHFSMSLLKQDLHAGLAGALFAQRLIHALNQALNQALQDDANNIKWYDNEDEYIGSLMADLLRGTAWSQWQYQEFSALRYVDEDEAAIQILMARPDTLVTLLKVLTKQNAIERLLVAITLARSHALFEQWSECKIEGVFKLPLLHTLSELSMLISSDCLSKTHIGIQEPLSVAILNAFLRSMQDATKQPINLPCAITTIAHITFVHRHKLLIQNYLDQEDYAPSLVDQNLSVLDNGEQQIIHSLKDFIAQSVEHKDYIKKILAISEKSNKDSKDKNADAIEQRNNVSSQTVYCAHAGVILLLPVIVSLGLRETYSNIHLRKALLNVAQTNEDDPSYCWIEWLLPIEDNDCRDLPKQFPTSLQIGLNKEQRNELDKLNTVPETQLARLMSMQLAVRLSGLQLSSAQYLNEQFLHVAGTFTQDELGVHALLAPISLNIVLSMSGFSPWQQPLNWLNQTLSIEVRS